MEPVHLKPILGLHPGLYATIIVVVVLSVAIFLATILPGILNGGKRVTFTSPTEPTAVYVDGRYLGQAPVTAFIASGDHSATFSFEQAFSEEVKFTVSHPVFLTWLFPRYQTVASTLTPDSDAEVQAYLQSMLDDIAAWSAIVDFDERNNYPPLMTRVATSLPENSKGALQRYFTSALRYMTGPVMVADAANAIEVANSRRLLPAEDYAKMVEQLELVKALHHGAGGAIGTASTALSLPVSRQPLTIAQGTVIQGFGYGPATFVMGGSRNLDYPGVTEMGVTVEVPQYFIAEQETTEYQWALFLQDNPDWAKIQIERLIEQGLADTDYLAGIYPSTAVVSNKPIRNISAYAATAYCEWLSKKTGVHVSLPTEAQWELAALANSSKAYATTLVPVPDGNGPVALRGGVWELTSSAFIPLSRYLGPADPVPSNLPVIVKGGSLLNDPKFTTAATVGVQSASTCSETTGFRIVWTY